MERTAEFAGFLAAHGIWCVADGEPLVPMPGQEPSADGRRMLRFGDEDIEQAVAQAFDRLQANPPGRRPRRAGLRRLHGAGGRPDRRAVRRARSCGQAPQTLRIVVPYRNAGSERGVAVYPPGFVDWQGEGEPDLRAAGAASFRGVKSQGEAAAVWADHFVDPA